MSRSLRKLVMRETRAEHDAEAVEEWTHLSDDAAVETTADTDAFVPGPTLPAGSDNRVNRGAW